MPYLKSIHPVLWYQHWLQPNFYAECPLRVNVWLIVTHDVKNADADGFPLINTSVVTTIALNSVCVRLTV